MEAARIDMRRIAQTKLQIDRRGDADNLRNLMVACESAQSIGTLNIEIYRDRYHPAQRRQGSQRYVRGNIDRAKPLVRQQLDTQRIGGPKQSRSLDHQVRREPTALACLVDKPEQSLIGDQNAAQTQLNGSLDILESIDHLIQTHMSPAKDLAIGSERLRASFPGRAWTNKQADLYPMIATELSHLADFRVA